MRGQTVTSNLNSERFGIKEYALISGKWITHIVMGYEYVNPD